MHSFEKLFVSLCLPKECTGGELHYAFKSQTGLWGGVTNENCNHTAYSKVFSFIVCSYIFIF